jgi:hypothetical protein
LLHHFVKELYLFEFPNPIERMAMRDADFLKIGRSKTGHFFELSGDVSDAAIAKPVGDFA